MNWTTILILFNAFLAIVLQIFLPKLRHFIFAIGAFIAILLSTLRGESLHQLFELLPLDVLAILLALELYGDIVIESKIFETMTKFLATICSGKGWLIIVSFSMITYVVSCFMDNYQCLLLLIPPMLGMLRQVNVSKLYLQIIFGMLIVTSNLGGASTPIGDFPALYMLSQGIIDFNSYLLNATPLLLISITLCVIVALAFYLFKPLTATPQDAQTSVIFTKNLYRNIKIDWKILFPALLIFIGMSYFWINGYDATKVAIGGFLVLGLCIKWGQVAEVKIRKKNASTFLYYLFLFVIVVSIQKTGILTQLADYLMNFKDNKQLMLFLFITATTIVTGIVSAGPSTVAMFPIVQVISPLYPEHMVISCFVLSICAGSSLFLTSATAGPLMSRLTEQYNVIANGQKYSYTFRDYLLPGFIGASIIYLVNLSYIFITL
jgi:Na+/H+ antiporter NhaD/arsenite permease-like protein